MMCILSVRPKTKADYDPEFLNDLSRRLDNLAGAAGSLYCAVDRLGGCHLSYSKAAQTFADDVCDRLPDVGLERPWFYCVSAGNAFDSMKSFLCDLQEALENLAYYLGEESGCPDELSFKFKRGSVLVENAADIDLDGLEAAVNAYGLRLRDVIASHISALESELAFLPSIS
jgi:hypothetical protein